MTSAAILTVNIGSSSLKFALFHSASGAETRVGSGSVEGIGGEQGRFRIELPGAAAEERTTRFEDHEAAMRIVFDALSKAEVFAPAAIGHRVVHGGTGDEVHAPVDDRLLATLRRAIPFAPLHLPAEIRGIETAARLYPTARQVACFDTAFHRRLPELSRRFPLPRAFHDRGIQRYGFHGLSYEYLAEKLASQLGKRTIFAHLGNGASMVALAEGQPVETTMGLTPAGGFMSGTRTGDLDPGVLIHLARAGHGTDDLERIVNQESGILGVSGSTADMRTILSRYDDDERAALALEMFCYQARKAMGALMAVLGGVDSLVFTGGVGGGAAPVRQRICRGLEGFGIVLDGARNVEGAEVISAPGASCVVRVVPTDEEIVIARHTRRILAL